MRGHGVGRFIPETKNNDTRKAMRSNREQVPEIEIKRQHYPLFASRFLQDISIGEPDQPFIS
jgi:hypothetical protein